MVLFLLACRSEAVAPEVVVSEARADCSQDAWVPWEPGFDVRVFETTEKSRIGDSRVVVARVDPRVWRLSLHPGSKRTGEQWAADKGLVAVTNAGMFHKDHRTHVGSMRVEGVEVGRQAAEYQSVAEFGESSTPPFRIRDLDGEFPAEDYPNQVQNLRLIKHVGENRWSKQDKRWSEAALGEDEQGNALLIFSRSPWSMHDLNEELLAADLGLVAAQHLEGGPEATLFIELGGCRFDGFGSYETGFVESDDNDKAWGLPNVLGVSRTGD